MFYLQSIFVIIFSFTSLLLTENATAWSDHDRYHKGDRSHHYYKHHRHHKKYHPRHTPNWDDYHHRLHYRFNFHSHVHPWHYHDYPRYTDSNGWEMIKKDRPRKAMEIFDELADRNPNRGEPKVGLAIAAAQSRQMSEGVRFMRRALKDDPESLNRIRMTPKLYEPIKQVAEEYRSGSHRLNPGDKHFMGAALYYLMGELDICFEEIEKGTAVNDQNSSTMNLHRLAGYNG